MFYRTSAVEYLLGRVSVAVIRIILVAIPIIGLTFLGCSSEPASEPTADTPNTNWPTRAAELVEHLNQWPKDELDVYERPEAYEEIGRVASGETGGWVQSHKDELQRLSSEVRWNSTLQHYELSE